MAGSATAAQVRSKRDPDRDWRIPHQVRDRRVEGATICSNYFNLADWLVVEKPGGAERVSQRLGDREKEGEGGRFSGRGPRYFSNKI